MALPHAVLFACIATACAWQAQMIVRNPENNPLLNDPKYGPLQNAWKALERKDPYVLMFRSKNHEPNITCVTVNSTIHNETLKIANYTRTYYNKTSSNWTSLEFQVRALNQSDYKLENVIRAGLTGNAPSSTPIPLGSNMYIEYGDYSCNSSSKPLWQMLQDGTAPNKKESSSSDPVEGKDYLDFYVVFNQKECNVLRSPFLQGGCDLWLNQSLLADVLKNAENLAQSIDAELATPKAVEARGDSTNANTGEKKTDEKEANDKTKERVSAEAVFKSLPIACRYAFISSCGYPQFMMYEKEICNKTEDNEAATTTE